MNTYCNNVITINNKKNDKPIALSMMWPAHVVRVKIKYIIGTIVYIILTINNDAKGKIH